MSDRVERLVPVEGRIKRGGSVIELRAKNREGDKRVEQTEEVSKKRREREGNCRKKQEREREREGRSGRKKRKE